MKSRILTGVAAALLAISAVTSVTAKEAPPAPGPLKKLAFPAYSEMALKNGLQVVVVDQHGEIVEPVIKLADPGPEFKSVVTFLKKNSEALASSRTRASSSLAAGARTRFARRSA